MKKDVAQYLEFSFEKLNRLKQFDHGEVWRAKRRSAGELVIIKRVNEVGLLYDALKNNQFTLPAKIFCAPSTKLNRIPSLSKNLSAAKTF